MPVHCPSCAEPICPPAGRSDTILVIGESPTRLDMEIGRPFSTSMRFATAGRVLRKELEMCGVSLQQFRIANLWLHEPNDSETCWQAGYNHILEEAKGKKAILLIGADVVETFTKYKVSNVSGLEVDSHTLSAPIIYAIVSPALALHRGVGEVRNGIEKFIARLDKEGLL